ncbi:MAG: MerR family transcriptional regulator [Bacteroidetes bacterium]|jgi:DNA-binding transcriptional MerR regulator|nr:MerR family transcriptional regulator [Bacteroidota bacterium]
MPEEEITKLYYAIGEVSEMTDLEPHVLRYWESEFEMLHPRKNRAGRRVYTEEDIAMVRRIQHLLRVDKYTIAGARQVLERAEAPAASQEQRQELLRLRGFLHTLLQKLENGVD